MSQPIPINLVVEDDLSEAVLRRIISATGRPYEIGTCYLGRGFGYIKEKIQGFNSAAKSTPFLILTDLDKTECPSALISAWLKAPVHSNLLFRIAVKEVEAWLLADRIGFSRFLRISESLISKDVETLDDPKLSLINLVRNSPRRDLRLDIVPPQGSTRQIGPNYNGQLVSFVRRTWDLSVARKHSRSLTRTISALEIFNPTWSQKSEE